jgi:hypothetical protein
MTLSLSTHKTTMVVMEGYPTMEKLSKSTMKYEYMEETPGINYY